MKPQKCHQITAANEQRGFLAAPFRTFGQCSSAPEESKPSEVTVHGCVPKNVDTEKLAPL